MKRDIVQHFGVAPEHVDVTPLDVDHDHFKPAPPDQLAMFKAQHGIGDHAIFYLSSIEPRKNLARLIEAFARIEALGLANRVSLLSRVSDDALPK